MSDLAHIPDDTMIPLKDAHYVFPKSKATIHRWVARGIVPSTETTHGIRVRMGDLRAAEKSVRHGGRRTSSETK
jgi:hypothetical protein